MPHRKGLHYLDLRKYETAEAMLASTVRSTYKEFTNNQLNASAEACRLQRKICTLSQWDFEWIVHGNIIQKCPITAYNVTNTCKIFGLNPAGVGGKTVWRKSDKVIMEYISIPKSFFVIHKYVTLAADVVFVIRNPFLITVNREIILIMVENTPWRVARI